MGQTGKLNSLQALRFFAALAVVCCHAFGRLDFLTGHPYNRITEGGVFGVDVFFVLSGFVIARSALFTAKPTGGLTFFRRRWLRVAPIYFVLSIPWILWAVTHDIASWGGTVATFLFWPAGPDKMLFPYLGVGWTLCFEMLFYTGMAAYLALGRSRFALGAIVAGAVGCSLIFLATGAPVAGFLGSPMILEFAAGVWLAHKTPKSDPALGLFLCGLGVIALSLGWAFAWGVHADDLRFAENMFKPVKAWLRVGIFALPAILFVAGALRLETWARGALGAALSYMGDASYSLYLTHLTLIVFASSFWLSLGLPTWLFPILAIPASLALSVAVYEYLEKPLLAALRRPRWVLKPA